MRKEIKINKVYHLQFWYRGTSGKFDDKWGTRETIDTLNSRLYY